MKLHSLRKVLLCLLILSSCNNLANSLLEDIYLKLNTGENQHLTTTNPHLTQNPIALQSYNLTTNKCILWINQDHKDEDEAHPSFTEGAHYTQVSTWRECWHNCTPPLSWVNHTTRNLCNPSCEELTTTCKASPWISGK